MHEWFGYGYVEDPRTSAESKPDRSGRSAQGRRPREVTPQEDEVFEPELRANIVALTSAQKPTTRLS